MDLLETRAEEVLAFMGAYFMKKSPVHRAAEEITRRLEAAGIDYALAGAVGLGVYGYVRATDDVDIIITKQGLAAFKDRWVGLGYANVFKGGKSVRDTENNVKIDFLIAGEFPGDGKPKPVTVPVPATASVISGNYRVVSLTKLIELKLASGMSAAHRGKDLIDIQELIHRTKLPRALVYKLNPYVRDKYIELWDIAQHPDDDY